MSSAAKMAVEHTGVPGEPTATAPAADFTGWAMPNWGADTPAGSAGKTNLGSGQIAGIVIGTIGTMVIVLGIALFLMRHQRRERRASALTLIGDEESKEGYMGRSKSVDEATIFSKVSKPRTIPQDSENTSAPAYSEDPIPLYQAQAPPVPIDTRSTAPTAPADDPSLKT